MVSNKAKCGRDSGRDRGRDEDVAAELFRKVVRLQDQRQHGYNPILLRACPADVIQDVRGMVPVRLFAFLSSGVCASFQCVDAIRR